MSHHRHHEGRRPMRPCYIATAALGLLLLAGAYLFGCPASPLARGPEPIDPSKFATADDLRSLRDEGTSLFGGLESGLVRRIDGLREEARRHRSEDNARLSANDKESFRLIAELKSSIAAESVIRGQQITGERAQRRRETGELFESRDKVYASLLAHRDEIVALRKQLFAVEQAWLKHKCPEPCRCSHTPPVPSKVLPPSPPPNMYTIPYQRYYERPKACPLPR